MSEEKKTNEQETVQTHALKTEELRSLIDGETSTSTGEGMEKDAAGAEEAEKEKEEERKEEEKTEGDEEKAKDASEEKITVSKTEYEKLSKQVKDKEQFIQRQAHEIGDLRHRRQNLEAEIDGIKMTINTDTLLENPLKAMEDMKVLDDKRIQVEAINRIETAMVTKEVINRDIPEFESLIDTIAEIALKDGIPAQNVETFKRNPYAEPPELLLAYAKRAQETRTYGAEKQRLAELTRELEESKKKSGEFLKNIENAASKKTVSSKTGGATSSKDAVFSKPIHQMTQAELKQALNGGLNG